MGLDGSWSVRTGSHSDKCMGVPAITIHNLGFWWLLQNAYEILAHEKERFEIS